MTTTSSLPEILADIRRKTREPFQWQQVKALQPLFYIRLAGVLLYVLTVADSQSMEGILPFPYIYGEYALNAATAVCLFFLWNAHGSYKSAFIFMVLGLLICLVPSVVGSTTLITVFSSLCIMLSNCLEYIAHSKLTMRQDKHLTAKWNNLFFWNVGAMVAGGGAFLVTLVASYVPSKPSYGLYLLMLAVTYIPDLIVDVLFLVYLGKTIRLIKSQKILQ